MRAGAANERGELRPVQGAGDREENEELQRRDQVEAAHLVFSERGHRMSPLFYRSGGPCFEIHPLLSPSVAGVEFARERISRSAENVKPGEDFRRDSEPDVETGD